MAGKSNGKEEKYTKKEKTVGEKEEKRKVTLRYRFSLSTAMSITTI